MSFAIFADSACDIRPDILATWGVRSTCLTFRFTDDEEKEYLDNEMPPHDFYAAMRAGRIAKTAAVNAEGFVELFEPTLKEGKDLLYIAFSSGISSTYNAGRVAVEMLAEKYPERKIMAVDTLAASAGYGLLLYLTVKEQEKGATIEEARQFVLDNRLHLCHWFTVDDLVYLKRGGRVSAAKAFVGKALGIKPVMHVDDEGKLINMFTVHGRKKAIAAMAQKYTETAITPNEGHVFISHGDCIGDAEELARLIREAHGVNVELIADVGPVIGAHSGPGTLALFFLGKQR